MQTAIVKLLTADEVKNYLKVTTVQIEDFELTTVCFNVWDKKSEPYYQQLCEY